MIQIGVVFISSLLYFLFIIWLYTKCCKQERLRTANEPRAFNSEQKNIIWKRDKGRCKSCGIKVLPYSGSDDSCEFDHLKVFSKGGRTIISNGRILCRKCNRIRGNKYDNGRTNWKKVLLRKK